MKLNGIVGKGSGKLGASVFAISGGEQIVRQYNPQVSNPSTDAQVAQRAKLKLMSQIAADLAPALGFKKLGLVSARNQFVSKNIALATYEDGAASVEYSAIQVTSGSQSLPSISVERYNSSDNVQVTIGDGYVGNITHIVVTTADAASGERLALQDVKIAAKSGEGTFSPIIANATGNKTVVYVYGIISAAGNENTRYDDYALASSGSIAELEVAKSLIATATAFTQSLARVLNES